MRLGVVADDLTGATDAGSMTAKAGYLTHVFRHDAFEDPLGAEVCVLDTDSRFDDAAVAYAKVRTATEELLAAGCRRFHKKTCSVFRGNVGPEFDAMLDALGEEFAVVVLGFPKNGRTTVDGVHHVGGVRLEDTAFRHDPVHPMTRSRLADILGSQTERQVALLTHAEVAAGAKPLARALSAARDRGGYLIIDVVDQAALATIARAVTLADVRVLCGASGLLEELALVWPPPKAGTPDPKRPFSRPTEQVDAGEARPRRCPDTAPGPVLMIAGSLTPQTAAQVERVASSGVLIVELDAMRLLDERSGRAASDAAATAAAAELRHGRDVLVRSAADPALVRATQAAGAARGLDTADTGRTVSAALSEVAARCADATSLTGLIVAGGDTSAAVCRRLGLNAFRVGAELAPGVPVCRTLERPLLNVVLKSGSFGAPDLLLRAAERLREDGTCAR